MSKVRFRLVNEREFETFLEEEKVRYAHSIAKNRHVSFEEALKSGDKQINELFSEGMHTPGHYVFLVEGEEQVVGNVWICINEESRRSFLYNIFIHENQQGKGFGTAALKEAESWLKERGIQSFGLHVFAHNTGAKRLYERLGFEVTSVNMTKNLSS
ncbi:GNAT family N-acetyltransferase [Metabacillus iocasae]|uniref:RimJ/RimL family protein N-acetyltransferase n=1 Tax=Priestia iocasae TaxID=2291674 RepID=A0ABS2QXT1_9BACI|nr:GNAT family N-acetyltransferase [Metabacillus iocasae]MBM7704291.1 RimJ/RimL family protein N-acetyltransferase [Metabacillus iocasae]